MNYCKVIGAVLLLLSGVLVAGRLNKIAAEALRQAEAWESLTEEIKRRVESFSLPISDILEECGSPLLFRCGYTQSALPRDLSEMVKHTCFYDAELANIAERFALEFGYEDRDAQTERCKYFASLISEKRKGLGDALPEKRKLNLTVSLSICLGLLIFFI